MTASPATDQVVSGVHRLAAGTELLGEYLGSGFQQPRYLVRRADGQVLQLPHLLYRVTCSLDGRTDAEVAEALSAELEQELTGQDVAFLVEEKLRPVGVVESDADATALEAPAPARSDPLLALRYRVGVVPSSVAAGLARGLGPLFRRWAWTTALVVFLAVDCAVLLSGGLLDGFIDGVRSVIREPHLILVLLLLQVVGGMFHELGHVTACRFGGARPGNMGVGVYLVWPAFYSDVTDAYRLDRVGRLRTDLGGVYFNALFMTGLSGAYLVTDQSWLLLALVALHTETAWQFLPSIRLDGYYVLADLAGVPDPFRYVLAVLRSVRPGRPADPRLRELRPWPRRVVTAWVATTVPVLLGYLVVFAVIAPRVVPVAWREMLAYLDVLEESVRTGAVLDTTLGSLQLVLLLLPWAGAAMATVTTVGLLRGWASARWRRGRAPERRAPERGRVRQWTRVLVHTTVAGVAVVLLARVWSLATSLPASTREVTVTSAAFAALGPGPASLPVSGADLVLRQQVAGYAGLTGAFSRHDDLLTGGRELAVAATAVLVGCLLATAQRYRVRPLAVVLPLGAVVAVGPLTGLLAGLSAPLVGAAWAAVGLLALFWHRRGTPPGPRRRSAGGAVGVVALLVGVGTAPAVLLPLAAAAAVVLVRGQVAAGRPAAVRGVAAAALVALGVVATAVGTGAGTSPQGSVDRPVVLLVAGLLVAGGAAVDRLRPWAAAAGSLVVAAALPWAGATALLPLVLCAVAPLAVLLVQALVGAPVGERPHPLLRAGLAVPVLVVSLAGALFVPASASTSPHAALADWLLAPSAPTAPVQVPGRLWADLVRDGVPERRLTPRPPDQQAGPEWAVVEGDVPAGGPVVATFGSGPGRLTVLAPASARPDAEVAARETAARSAFGGQLAVNPRLDTPEAVRAAIRSGAVDSRVLMVVAGLAAQHTVSVGALPPVPGEDPSRVPPHALLVSGLDGRPADDPTVVALLSRWLDAQRGPLSPALVSPQDGGVLVQWSVPAPVPLLAR